MAAAADMGLFETMLLMRHFEETVVRLFQDKQFGSHYHLYIGQEATGAAVLATLAADDPVCTTHRNHGHIVGRGADPGRALAEICGRATGFSGGRGGTLHLCDAARGFLSTSAIVGGCAGLAAGGIRRHLAQHRRYIAGRFRRRRTFRPALAWLPAAPRWRSAWPPPRPGPARRYRARCHAPRC